MLAVLAADAWVYADAKEREKRGSPVVFAAGSLDMRTPAAWFLGCLILFVVFFPLYVTTRNRAGWSH